ncbi:MAG: exo-alpha-sialidase [Planctomycetes bacterium]|nr:exo-alpha-sialidase [Planctomycetota bacterium]
MSKRGVVLELPPSKRNPRNSEGAFVTLGNGKMCFAYSKFTGGGGDDAEAVIATRMSPDAGVTWTTRDRVLIQKEGAQNVMSVSFLRLQDERIAFFYVVKNGFHDCRMRVRFSEDEAKTWSDPVLCIPAPGYFVTNNDRVVQLSSGRLIVPCAYHRVKTIESESWTSFDTRGIAIYFLSDDGGLTWRESNTWWALPTISRSGLQEPGVVELNDGRLFSWCRTDRGCQYGMYSTDHGETWSFPQPTGFRSPCSPLSMKRIPSTGDLLAVWNDHSGRFDLAPPGPMTGARTPLASAISRDEGNTWENIKLVEDDPNSGYCYTAMHFSGDDHVLLAYCAGGKKYKGVLNNLRIRRIRVDWFYS